MDNVTVFRLAGEVHFAPPRAWSVQARYAFVYHQGGPFVAETGRLVTYLGPRHFFDGQEESVEHLYRLSDGRVGVLDASPDGRFTPVGDPEVTALAALVRTLPELVAEKGLHLETTSRLDPFALLACPLCRGTEFTTIDLAGVWCNTCNARFTTRMTAGDPGVVVDADPAYYYPAMAHYIVPRRDLTLTVVLKDFGYSSHPEGKCGEYCVNGTTYEERAERMRYYVSAPTSLRDPAHWCGLEVYDWSPSGEAERPDPGDRDLRDIVDDPEAGTRIYDKQVRSQRLTPVDLLAKGTCPEADRWSVAEGACPEPVEGTPGEETREWWYLADVLYSRDLPWWPVWWKVRAVLEPSPCGEGQIVKGWLVTDRTLCPGCLRPAADGDHQSCRWDEMDWQPE